ncbi:YicC/YloC family endoribonuclease [Oceanobacillus kapialis]
MESRYNDVIGCDSMVMSMTGYGTHVSEHRGHMINIEIRSVNHRFLDFTAKLPSPFGSLEDEIKKIIQSTFHRGKVEVALQIVGENVNARNVHTDWAVLDQYVSQLRMAQERYGLSGEVSVDSLTLFPEIFSVREEASAIDLHAPIMEAIQTAAIQMKDMRLTEGQFLGNDLKKRLDCIKDMAKKIEFQRPAVIGAYKERIWKRLNQHLSELDELDYDRIHQEVVLLAEKGDVTEELTRLYSHITHFQETLKQEGTIGRKLDFIIQEMQREGNTIGSKSNDPTISELVVNLKSELEKMKEQVQNIE